MATTRVFLRRPLAGTLHSPHSARAFSRAATRSHDVFHSQQQDQASAALLRSLQHPPPTPQTLTEKLFQRHAKDLPEGKLVRSGDFITLSPHRCMTHDNSWPVALKFMEMGATNLHNPNQIVMTLDHDVQNKSETNLKKYRQIEEFARQQHVDFYPAGHGIGHQIMCEQGYAFPGTVAVASDSHSNMYGGLGCLGTPVVRTGAADIWATGSTWFRIPPVAKVTLLGRLPPGATGKDVIVALCGIFNNDEVLNHAIEFVGSEDTMRSLPIDDRLAIANMTTEWGALSGLFPIDSLLKGYLRFRATEASMYADANVDTASPSLTRLNHDTLERLFAEPLAADRTARYAKSLFLDLSTIPPFVSGPNSVKVATPVHELERSRIKVDRAYLVSCTNSRASDIAAAARVFKDAAAAGRPARIPEHVSLYIAAASAAEQRRAEADGDWQALLAAGAQPLPSGCGPCIGLGTGLLEPGEVGVSASNRNFKGRMGSTDAKAYLASPEVVAASALAGHLAGPGRYVAPPDWAGIVAGEGAGIERRFAGVEEALEKLVAQADSLVAAGEAELDSSPSPSPSSSASSSPAAEIVPGFPASVRGEIIFCDADNINTDGIYPGRYTYQDNVPRATMAQVCMSNYDSSFDSLARESDILVAGSNFGTGSSREQAATALLARGIPLVVAASFGNIFATNSVNNALMGLEVPALVDRLRARFQDKTPTRRTGWTLEWDVRRSVVTVTDDKGEVWSEDVPEIPPNVQRIVAGGGLVRARQAMFGVAPKGAERESSS